MLKVGRIYNLKFPLNAAAAQFWLAGVQNSAHNYCNGQNNELT